MVEDEDTDARTKVEPLFAALRGAPRDEGAKTLQAGRSHLGWKLLWAALVLLALLAIVLNQAF
jgi:hypothetical protein